MKLDLPTIVGKATCDLATSAGQTLELGQACARSDFPTMGYITTALLIMLALLVYSRRREIRRRNRYLL